MSFKSWADSKVMNLSWMDVKLTQLGAAAFVLMIAKLWTPLLNLSWYWYLLIAVAAMIKPGLSAFRKTDDKVNKPVINK